jgi:hypothetical protein
MLAGAGVAVALIALLALTVASRNTTDQKGGGSAPTTPTVSLDPAALQYRDLIGSAVTTLDADLAAARRLCGDATAAACTDQTSVLVGVVRRLADELATAGVPAAGAGQDAVVRAAVAQVLSHGSGSTPVIEQLADAADLSAAIHAELRALGAS